MASREKAQEFFEKAKVMDQYKTLMEQIASNVQAIAEARGDDVDVAEEMSNIQKKISEIIGNKISDFVIAIYEDLFTNEELDEFIKIYSLPVFQKNQALQPEIGRRSLKLALSVQDEVQTEVELILNSKEGAGL